MSDTTRNDGNIQAEHDTPPAPAPAYREPEPLDYDAPAIDDRGAHAVGRDDAAADANAPVEEEHLTHSSDAAASPTVPASVEAPAPAAPVTQQHPDTTATQQYPDYSAAAPAVTSVHEAPAQPSAPTPIYVQAPTPPRNRGNRGPGILIALVATAAYAVLFGIVVWIIAAISSSSVGEATNTFAAFIIRPVFYIPVIFFFLAFAVLVAIVNRARWWAYVLGGFLVAVVVYLSYIGGALLTVRAWEFQAPEAGRFLSTQWLTPFAVASAILAREVPVWFGAWIARNGRKVTERNAEARREYDRQIAEGPQLVRP